jgi:serine/threonine protein kinase
MTGSVGVKVNNAEVSTLNEGQYFGEKALMSEEVRAATCVATSKVTCLSLGRNQFKERLGKLQDILERKEAPKETASSGHTPGGPGIKDEYYLEISFKELEEKRTLGQGAFGRVKLVTHKTTGQTYALKCLIKEDIVANNLQDHVMNERNVMRMLDHPFILHLHNTYKDSKYVYFLLELALGGELFTFLRKMGRFNEKTGRFYAAQVVLGFQHMHSKDILYRDLKPENLILDSKGYLKIVDFGLAKVCHDKTWTLCGTPDYLAPEIILSRGHDKAVDYWALGVLEYEMCAGYVPFYSDDPMEVYQLILAGDIRFPTHLSRACTDLCKKLMNPQATKRLGTSKNGIKDIIKHKWFSGFDWKGLISFENAAPIQVAIEHAEDASNFDFYPEEDESQVPSCPSWDPDF